MRGLTYLENIMKGIDKVLYAAAGVVLLAAVSATPAKAQFGGGSGGEDMMTQMAPMLEMMKARMGKRRFAQLMQTVGPMMSNMMDNGGGLGGGGVGGSGLGGGMGGGFGGSGMNFANMGGMGGGMGGFDAGQVMGMIPQFMSMANMGGGSRHARRARRYIR